MLVFLAFATLILFYTKYLFIFFFIPFIFLFSWNDEIDLRNFLILVGLVFIYQVNTLVSFGFFEGDFDIRRYLLPLKFFVFLFIIAVLRNGGNLFNFRITVDLFIFFSTIFLITSLIKTGEFWRYIDYAEVKSEFISASHAAIGAFLFTVEKRRMQRWILISLVILSNSGIGIGMLIINVVMRMCVKVNVGALIFLLTSSVFFIKGQLDRGRDLLSPLTSDRGNILTSYLLCDVSQLNFGSILFGVGNLSTVFDVENCGWVTDSVKSYILHESINGIVGAELLHSDIFRSFAIFGLFGIGFLIYKLVGKINDWSVAMPIVFGCVFGGVIYSTPMLFYLYLFLNKKNG